jgi:hypothetical protein
MRDLVIGVCNQKEVLFKKNLMQEEFSKHSFVQYSSLRNSLFPGHLTQFREDHPLIHLVCSLELAAFKYSS